MDLAVDISTGLPHDHEEVVHIEGPGPVVDLVEEVLDLDVSGVLPGSSHGVLKGLKKHKRNFECFMLCFSYLRCLESFHSCSNHNTRRPPCNLYSPGSLCWPSL